MQTNSKLREALSDAAGLLESILEAFSKGTGGAYMSDVAEAIDNARAALDEPIRNCEVGTAEEQAKRLDRFCTGRGCRFGGDDANKCPLNPDFCELAWAQMPYQKEDDNGGNGDSDE